MNYQEEKKYIGHRDQLIRVTRVERKDGKAKGTEHLQVQNRSGMGFEVNLSRGMDIPYFEFCGENIGFISPCGVVGPEYFDDKGLGFLKSFTTGFLTTCGLKNIGSPCEYQGTSYGLHGNLSNTPAEQVSYSVVEEEERPYVRIKGQVRDEIIFGDKLVLDREIKCFYKEKSFSIKDRVTNTGYQKARHMILYHCNIGFPLLSPESEIFIPALQTKARNAHAETGIQQWMHTQEPDPDYEEMCYYHTMKGDSENRTAAAVYNDGLGFGAAIEYDLRTLDHLVQWKMMGARDYVMGLEPGNATLDGIQDAVDNGSMKYLEAGESVEYHLSFRILQGRNEFESLKKRFS